MATGHTTLAEEFTDGQIAIIQRTAMEAADVTVQRYREAVNKDIELHAAKCPLKDDLNVLKGQISKAKTQVTSTWKTVVIVAALVAFIIDIGLRIALR
jgi:hypothetical protein